MAEEPTFEEIEVGMKSESYSYRLTPGGVLKYLEAIQEDENPADTIDLDLDDYGEWEWCFKAVAASREVQYSFRVTVAVTPIITYI